MGLLNSEFNNTLRQELLKRNLYNPQSPYEINNPKLVETINLISDIVSPGNAFDITSTIIGRSLGIGPQTPIVVQGTREFSRQMARNIAFLSVEQILPEVSLKNLFDGDPSTRLFSKKEDFQITVVEGQTKLGRFIQEITGFQSNSSPFNKNTTNTDLVRNTGSGQLKLLAGQLNQNIYRPSFPSFLSAMNDKDAGLNDGTVLYKTRTYFSEVNSLFVNAIAVNELVREDERGYRIQLQEQIDANEYSTSAERIKDLGLGKLRKKPESVIIDGNPYTLIQSTEYGFDGDYYLNGDTVTASDSQIVWGRDTLVGNPANKFGVRTGLLHKTDALLQARGAKNTSFNRTLKTFKNLATEEHHFNGTPFRQFSATDQYSTYRKAIRYEGNQIYGGNPNSVIYKRVIPKFHPDVSQDIQGNKNIMFTIENLSYLINDDGDTGIQIGTKKMLVDGKEENTPLTLKVPLSEVGPNGGRLMWFMPYDIRIDESDISRHDPLYFVGRPEPMYSYINSERTLTLSFMLLIDYPPQLIGKTHNEIAKFFALGSTSFFVEGKAEDVGKLQQELEHKEKELAEVTQVKKLNRPNETRKPSEMLSFYWLNDRPKVGNVTINEEISSGYENSNSIVNDSSFGGDNGLNEGFLDKLKALTTFVDKDNLKFYDIEITGSATQLYNDASKAADYNKKLSERRIEAVEKKFREYFFTGNAKQPEDFGMKIIRKVLGDTYSSPEGKSAAVMYDKDIKPERRTTIRLVPNNQPNEKVVDTTPEEKARRNTLITEINDLENKINNVRSGVLKQNDAFVERDIDDGISLGFKDLETPKRKVIPAFHSYTPEDFTKRLIFLRQLARPANSVITTTDTNGIPLVKNSVFGKPPVHVLRIGDFIHSKVIIENINYSYETPWDLNPEGMGMQPMICRVDMSIKLIGGQSMETPIDVIQNSESFNYYANSTFKGSADDNSADAYSYAKREEIAQTAYNTDNLKAKLAKKFNR